MKKIILILALVSGYHCHGMEDIVYPPFGPKGKNPRIFCEKIIKDWQIFNAHPHPYRDFSTSRVGAMLAHFDFCPNCSVLSLKDRKTFKSSKL
ncbi:MAG TPA: hypothetical protein VFF04_02065 [Candidatus Babeliales bacterium]|nr:hypothetical protein [Candidatus Babeliales bacterium]